MSQSRVVPARSDFDQFDPPFTEDERELVDFLDEHLPQGWEIYARPHLNGDWPSVAILHAAVGIVLYDVLQWEKGQFEAVMEQVEINNRSYSRRRFVPTDAAEGDEKRIKRINPIKQVKRYRDNLLGIYLPRIGEAVQEAPRYLKDSIAIGLYCPNHSTTKARNLLGGTGSECTIFGHNHLTPEALQNLVVPILGRNEEDFGIEEWAGRIRFFLNPPFHSEEMGEPIDLTEKQERYASPSPGKHLRLKGVAGSGKTLVLAQRAARNAAKGDDVLVVYYNITLGHYIRHYINRAPYSFHWDQIEIVHFHEFCKRYLNENGLEWPTGEKEGILTKVVPEAVIRAMDRGLNAKNRAYNVILIDEGQDFDEKWFEALYQFLNKPGEVLLVADERQNIYDRSHSYGGMQFSGPWGSLDDSYRMPTNLIREVNRFADEFVVDPDKEFGGKQIEKAARQTEFEFTQPRLIWRNVDTFRRARLGALKAVDHLTSKEEIHPQDIAILVPTHERGFELLSKFSDQGYSVSHVFGKTGGGMSRRNKKAFIMDDGRLKLSTIHSFKGWELSNIILITPEDDQSVPPKADLDLLLYTAITRARNNLIVFNQHPQYRDYGGGWPSSWN